MAKGKKRSRTSNNNWTASDHVAQEDKKSKTVKQQDRTALLTHNTREKREAAKLKLHLTKTQRAVTDLKHRLEHWDPVEEAARKKKRLLLEEEEQKRLLESSDGPALVLKKRGRKGPETWKLRGAARPAWEVYDFDTRYVDPFIAAHTAAAERANRSQNLLALHRGRLVCDDQAPDEAREYLGMLMQLGYLSQEAKQYRSARDAWLECVELEGSVAPATAARESLMRMYVDLKRYDAAYRLGERFQSDDSCMIRYSMALVACQLSKDETDAVMLQAVKSNIFTAYYLCYYETFASVMEYTEELQDSEDEPQSSFEEALEYCSSNHAALWRKTDGAMNTLKRILNDRSKLDPADVEWSDRLAQIEAQFQGRRRAADGSDDGDDDDGSDEDSEDGSPRVDLPMFVGMFRTAMDMLIDSGAISPVGK